MSSRPAFESLSPETRCRKVSFVVTMIPPCFISMNIVFTPTCHLRAHNILPQNPQFSQDLLSNFCDFRGQESRHYYGNNLITTPDSVRTLVIYSMMMRSIQTRSPVATFQSLPGRHAVCGARRVAVGGRRALQVCNVAAAPPMPPSMMEPQEPQPEEVRKCAVHAFGFEQGLVYKRI